MIQKEERVSGQDITVIKRKTRQLLVIGLASFGLVKE
jgi:hypothetical protein